MIGKRILCIMERYSMANLSVIRAMVLAEPRILFICKLFLVLCALSSGSNTALCNPPAEDGDEPAPRRREDDTSKKKRHVDGPFLKGSGEEELLEQLGDRYKSLYTDHFVVLYNTDAETVRSFVPRLERTYHSVLRFADRLSIAVEYEGDKLPIVFCSSRKEYERAYKEITGLKQAPPERSVGRYVSSVNACIFYDLTDFKDVREFVEKAQRLKEQAKRDPNRESRAKKLRMARKDLNRADIHMENQNRTSVQHEVAHLLLYNFGVHNTDGRHHNPQWLVEGLATLFEPPPGETGAGFGVVNQRRLGVIRRRIGSLTAANWRSFIAPSSASQGMLSGEGYGQAWALTYYLMKRKCKPLQQYLLALRDQSPATTRSSAERLEEFQGHFGEVDERFARNLARFVKKLPYRPP